MNVKIQFIDDNNNSVDIIVNKLLLVEKWPNFSALLPNDFLAKKSDQIIIKSPNAPIMKNIVLSLTKQEMTKLDYPDWFYFLEEIRCSHFFGIDYDTSKIKQLIVPSKHFDFLSNIIDTIIGYNDDAINAFVNNFPAKFDITKLSKEIVTKMEKLASDNLYNIKRDLITSLPLLNNINYQDLMILTWDWTCVSFNNKYIAYNIAGDFSIVAIKDRICVKKKFTSLKISSMCFSHNNSFLILGDRDGSIYCMVVNNGNIYRNQKKHKSQVSCISCSDDGRFYASAGRDKSIKIWNGVVPELKYTIKNAHFDDIINVRFLSDKKILVSGSRDTTIKIWNVTNGRLLTTLKSHDYPITDICFSPDYKLMASRCNKKINIWEVYSGKITNTMSVEIFAHNVVSKMVFSPDSQFIICGSYDHFRYDVWNVDDGKNDLLLGRKYLGEWRGCMPMVYKYRNGKRHKCLKNFLRCSRLGRCYF